MRRSGLFLGIAVIVLGSCLPTIASADPPRVLFLFPSVGVMGSEFFEAFERFEERGVVAEVAAGVTGSYTFWEDSSEGRAGNVPGGYEFEVSLTIDEVDPEIYDAILVGPGFAHAFWFEPGHDRGIEIILEAADRGLPLGGASFGVWVLLGQGLLDGRTACDWPHALGVVSSQAHWDGFLSGFDAVTFDEACVYTDLGVEGQSPIVTASYRCPAGFADAIVDLLVNED